MALQNLSSAKDVLKSVQDTMNNPEFSSFTADQILQAHSIAMQYAQVIELKDIRRVLSDLRIK